jgi:hypothetical protein
MCEFDFYSVQAISSSIRSLMRVGTFKRDAIKTTVYYGSGRFPKQTHTASIGYVDVMGIGHLEARRRADELVRMLPVVEGVTYHVRFYPVD